MSIHGNNVAMVEIVPARATDLPALFALLDYSGLPTTGLDSHLATTLVARDIDKHLVGSAGLEVYGTVALLRSVAVAPHLRGKRLGERLVLAALDLARERDVELVYLLTETARDFFLRFGFTPITRDEVSPALHQSAEWTTACSASAQAMVKRLAAQP